MRGNISIAPLWWYLLFSVQHKQIFRIWISLRRWWDVQSGVSIPGVGIQYKTSTSYTGSFFFFFFDSWTWTDFAYDLALSLSPQAQQLASGVRSVADNLVQIHHLETIPLFMISNCNFNPIPNRIETFCPLLLLLLILRMIKLFVCMRFQMRVLSLERDIRNEEGSWIQAEQILYLERKIPKNFLSNS